MFWARYSDNHAPEMWSFLSMTVVLSVLFLKAAKIGYSVLIQFAVNNKTATFFYTHESPKYNPMVTSLHVHWILTHRAMNFMNYRTK